MPTFETGRFAEVLIFSLCNQMQHLTNLFGGTRSPNWNDVTAARIQTYDRLPRLQSCKVRRKFAQCQQICKVWFDEKFIVSLFWAQLIE